MNTRQKRSKFTPVEHDRVVTEQVVKQFSQRSQVVHKLLCSEANFVPFWVQLTSHHAIESLRTNLSLLVSTVMVKNEPGKGLARV
jgi:hypothetical protein